MCDITEMECFFLFLSLFCFTFYEKKIYGYKLKHISFRTVRIDDKKRHHVKNVPKIVDSMHI